MLARQHQRENDGRIGPGAALLHVLGLALTPWVLLALLIVLLLLLW
jgi:hypothetical protein